ncbi:MAG: rhodanese-like domain-containing protein [Candidatus Lariskella arthropodorum]|uniref:rhodanese-like domain-containing protein n=1 Tax=Candidatus Lariskella endosymbiont of Epinotia ramella TaxID=3066224 RepID=UPI0030CC2A5F
MKKSTKKITPKSITSSELKEKIDKNEVLLIDVRERSENKSESIEGACSIALDEIALEKLPSNSKPIVLHCESGTRSIEACKKLLAQDQDREIYYLEGGIGAWKGEGFATKKQSCKILPVDRQTQLITGSIILLGVILGLYIHQDFYILSGLVGIGLIYAGITGCCGLSKLLNKMPWNKQ